MNKNILYGLIAVVVVVLVIVLVSSGGGQEQASPSPIVTATASVTASPTSVVSATPAQSATPASMTITYTANGFAPNPLTVKVGSTVVFKNASTVDMWPASAKHPSHNDYPEKGTCFSGVFTGCNIAPGGAFSMKFNVVGTWAYHDHLTTSKFGSIIVTP
ncbi:MAG: hypothetical protein AAB420_01575 [Patescibacteria group bacterium]